MNYKINSYFSIDVGFTIDAGQVEEAIQHSNNLLKDLPSTIYKAIDFKTLSSIVGSFFGEGIATVTDGIVNPVEHGYPDIIPAKGYDAPEKKLRDYPEGLELKCTIGGIVPGARLKAGESRIDKIKDITWKAHHNEVERLLGLVFDFVHDGSVFSYPHITGVFYSDDLNKKDWGKIAEGVGRTTNVTNMNASGKCKMGNGWVALLDDREYINRYQDLLKFDHRYDEFFG